MNKAQAYLIVTVFFIVFVLLIKNYFLTFKPYTLLSDKLRIRNVVNEIETFIPRFYTFDEKEKWLKDFISYVKNEEIELEIFVVLFSKNETHVKAEFIKKTILPIYYNLEIDENFLNGSVYDGLKIVVKSINSTSLIKYNFEIEKENYSNEFLLKNDSYAIFYLVSKKLENKNIIVYSDLVIY